ncbi:ferredoxin reductase family protein [Chitinispirillales bacterium ANBcel5]|uniref:ferric reductase-like transmembrane domain-containing protein n=1 Tax=Cellulosispirillum alkaliphilum TaxID=3039283 RepID=UPI002A4ECDAF|nr:ferredoxin reductase family protein [Chitinispirillales bacterium ANBcel5]
MGRIENVLPGNSKRIEKLKAFLIICIVFTSIAPLFFLDTEEPSAYLLIIKTLAKIGSLSATVLFFWQFLLGFRGGIPKIIHDLVWTINLHKKLGKVACYLLILHPIFITLYYLLSYDQFVLFPDFDDPFIRFVYVGVAAFVLLIVIFLTSVWLRKFLSSVQWYVIHLSSYIFLPLGLLHGIQIGSTVRMTPLRYGFLTISALYALLLLYRIIFRLGAYSKEYKVVEVQSVAHNVVEVDLLPVKEELIPRLGQFIYLRRCCWFGGKPYTVSGYDHRSRMLSVTIKIQSKQKSLASTIAPEEQVFLDGPYGVFSWKAMSSKRPLVMIAGGIGITPFIRIIRHLKLYPREAYLFYGNEKYEDIVYRDELAISDHVTVVNVLHSEPDFRGEKGFITTSLIKKYTKQGIHRYEHLLCGPPVMIRTVEKGLLTEGVDREQIHHELFGW